MVIDPATLSTTAVVDSGPRQPEWRRALQASLPVGIGLVPLGIALGVLVVQQGFNPWWAMVFTSLIFAGSLEFIAVGMVAAMTPLPYIALTALFVVLSIEATRAQRGFAVPSMAVMCALIARLVDPEHMLPIAMGAFVGLLVIRYLVTRRKVRTDA